MPRLTIQVNKGNSGRPPFVAPHPQVKGAGTPSSLIEGRREREGENVCETKPGPEFEKTKKYICRSSKGGIPQLLEKGKKKRGGRGGKIADFCAIPGLKEASIIPGTMRRRLQLFWEGEKE